MTVSKDMPAGTYTGCIEFSPPNPQSYCTNPDDDKAVSVSLLVLPAVTSISPIHGPAAGGTTVTIAGSGFTGATAVSFGSAVVNNPTVNGDTEITVVSPPW